jgi:deoxyinosine 3'endonuclease (endonuclease V)
MMLDFKLFMWGFLLVLLFFRDFRLILTPKKDILHSKFKAYTVDGDGQETPIFVGKFHFVALIL